MKFKKFITAFCFFSITLATFAETTTTQYPPEAREQIPAALNNSYMGLGLGYTDIPFSNSDLINGFQATSFTNPNFGINVFIGHYFNPYFAAEISLMRPFEWAYANGLNYPSNKTSIWISLFGITMRPTLPLSRRVSLYGLAGLGIVSRHGNTLNNIQTIPSADIATALTGGGLTYAITPSWHLNFGVEYSFARPDEQQPSIFYAYTGFYYLFQPRHLPAYYTSHYIFHKNMIQLGGFATSVFNPNVNKYFSVHYVPIFWTGDLNTRDGVQLMYERNIFHTHKRFSFDWGMSVSTYHTSINDTAFQAFSIFPDIRWWFFRAKDADIYFFYSVAGPTYLTKDNMDNIYLGGHFSFQDLLGLGAFLGKEKHFNIAATIGHYSNGNLLPNNPGVQVPLVISMGYAF
ncbi:MAG TPA: acyloxyacyl hydrolase [Coxiellaceae bacterium]|nr:MAG: hypothetical protein A3E81_07245 [Gammaproteobacteria bacterium RIFCSPHIGHO2_12_FULL_36_30]HLB57133.1 acyloxyacyl hydrolase [Coxiellaceae bacterium]